MQLRLALSRGLNQTRGVPSFEFPHSTETPEMNDLVQLSDRAGKYTERFSQVFKLNWHGKPVKNVDELCHFSQSDRIDSQIDDLSLVEHDFSPALAQPLMNGQFPSSTGRNASAGGKVEDSL